MSGRGCDLDHEVSSGARGAFFGISAYLTAYLSPYCRFADDWAEQEPRGQRGACGIVVIRPLADAFFGFSVSVPERAVYHSRTMACALFAYADPKSRRQGKVFESG